MFEEHPPSEVETHVLELYRTGQYNAAHQLLETHRQTQSEERLSPRLWILMAHIAFARGEDYTVRECLQKIETGNSHPVYQIERAFLQGELAFQAAPEKAIQHYQSALEILNTLNFETVKHLLIIEWGKIYQRRADATLYTGQMAQAYLHQIDAVHYARTHHGDDKSPLTGEIMLKAGQFYEQSGVFDKAAIYYEEAITLLPKAVEPVYLRAMLAWKMADDKKVALLLEDKSVDKEPRLTLVAAYAAITGNDFVTARGYIEQIKAQTLPRTLIWYQSEILHSFLRARLRTASGETLDNLEDALDYLMARGLHQEVYQARMILAWVSAVAGYPAETDIALRQCVYDIRRAGHVGHQWRIYDMARNWLASYWKFIPESFSVLRRLDDFPEHYAIFSVQPHLCLFGFSEPHMTFRGKVIETPYIQAMCFYLALVESASYDRIMATLWPNASDEDMENMNARLAQEPDLKLLFSYDNTAHQYRLNITPVIYCDVWAFQQIVSVAKKETESHYQLMAYQRAIDLYLHEFLAHLPGQFFFQQRQNFNHQLQRVLKVAITLAEELDQDFLIPAWEEHLKILMQSQSG